MRSINHSTKFKIMELVEKYGISCPIERGHMFKACYTDAIKYGLHDMRSLRVLVIERIMGERADCSTEYGAEI